MKLSQWRDMVVPYPADYIQRYRDAGLWADRTIGAELHRIAAEEPDRLALAGPGRTFSWREMDVATDRIGAGLLALGLQPGDAVLLQLDNTIHAVLVWYGLLKAALLPVATLSVYRGHEIRQIASITRAAAHIVHADSPKFDFVGFASKLAADNNRLVLTVGGSADSPMPRVEDLGAELTIEQARQAVEAAQRRIDFDDVAVFQLSGGTTGTPKVIPRFHAEYWYNAKAYARRQGWDRSVRTTHLGPLVHNAGIVCALHAAHAAGGAFIVGTPDPNQLLPVMAEYGVTDLVLFPVMVPPLQAHPDFKRAFAKVRRATFSVSTVKQELFDEFENRGIRVMGLFGMGEGLCLLTSPDDPPSVRMVSVGHELSEFDEVRLLEPGTETPAEKGEAGELCCRGPYTTRGYLNEPEQNLAAFTSDGFYRTGDLVAERMINGVRCYTFEGRTKDLVNRGGEKVSTAEIEGLIAELPGVSQVALVSIPDERLGERGCLCVRLTGQKQILDLSDIQRFLEMREVARYKWPERLELWDDLPLTAVGKVDKVRLRAQVLARIADLPDTDGVAPSGQLR